MSVQEINKTFTTKKFIASKKMGQNFLVNNHIKQKIVDAANLQKNDVILEIGPGTGAITSYLLMHKVKVVAIELDKRLSELLNTKFNTYHNFTLHNVDALKTNWDDLLKNYDSINKVKIVANLPYSISSQLVLKILKSEKIYEAIIMVQKEMADRISAKIKTHAYNAFSALVQLFCLTEKLFDVGKNNFSPPPKVESSVIKISKLKTEIDFHELETISHFFKLCFLSKRKTLINNLVNYYDKQKIINVFNELKWPPTIRAEEIIPTDLFQLMKLLNND